MKNAYIFAGVNGAGKTTLFFNELEKVKYFGIRINIDEIVSVSSINLAKERVKIRVKKGGHNIEPRLIEKRYFESFENLKKVFKMCSEIALFDNTISMQEVARFSKSEIENFDLESLKFILKRME